MDFSLTINEQSFNLTELKSAVAQQKAPWRLDKEWLADLWWAVQAWLSNSEVVQLTTSGSTGQPKPIEIQKSWMKVSAQRTLNALHVNAGDSALLGLPVKKVGGFMMMVRAFVGRLHLTVVEPKKELLLPQDVVFDFSALTPMQTSALIDLKDQLPFKKLIIGGGAVHPKLAEQLRSHQTICYETYGMTETVSHIALKALKGVKESFTTVDEAIQINQNENGCLEIHDPKIGVKRLVTNDIVQLHSKRSFDFIGRADDVINSGGLKIHPAKLEQQIANDELPNFIFYGLPDEVLGERLVAFCEGDIEVFKQACKQLERKLKPKAYYQVSLQYTSTNKVIRKNYLEEN